MRPFPYCEVFLADALSALDAPVFHGVAALNPTAAVPLRTPAQRAIAIVAQIYS